MYVNRRTFDWSSQREFARVSRDFNPIHVDAVQARRTHAGAPIVHGIHSLIWALDCFAQSEFRRVSARSLKVRFLQPIYVGDEVTLEISQPDPRVVRARIMVGPEEVADASIGTEDIKRSSAGALSGFHSCMPAPETPNDLSFENLEGLAGCLSLDPTIQEVGALFPSAVAVFGQKRIAALAASSCIVGMIVPGLHSLFSGLEVSLVEEGTTRTDGIEFAVLSITKRFRLARIAVRARGLTGSLETMSRMPPARQPSIDSLLPLVSAGEFSNSTALVVGGSRGLGELTSKLLSAGGAEVLITYSSGKSDADAVCEDIRNAGLKCATASYDVRRPAAEQLSSIAVKPTHVFFFATPLIFRRKNGLFDAARFEEFNHFYVSSFFDLVQACAARTPTLRVFYPSSIFVDSRPGKMTEYTMAKAAAEVLCSDMSRFLPGVQVLAPRLPRLPTDQTNSVVPADAANAVDVVLPLLREMFRLPATKERRQPAA